MDWGFLMGLSLITLLVIGLIVYLARKLSRFVQNHTPESDLAMCITPTGNALAALMVGLWGACIIAFKLAPNSKLGTFLGTSDGLTVVILGSFFFYVIAGLVLEKFGFPIAKRGGHDT